MRCFFLTAVATAALSLSLPTLAQSEPAPDDEPVWAFEDSDIPVDSNFVFGQLDNGMRYILRQNATPEGTALVRMRIDSGSLDETETELGLSHYLEHMAFNGSTGIPEGEMIKVLEREGLSFGADTNASTGFNAITYMLNLPRNDNDLLDTALMLMRETASELTIAEDAVERERGVILAERRDRRNFAQRALEDNFAFTAPDARFPNRLPIGTLEVLESATAAQLRELYERTYTPSNTVLVVIGDYPVDVMEAALTERFADWASGAAPVEPETGPVDITRSGLTDIYLDPALSESVNLFQFSPWQDRPDTAENRREDALVSVANGIINRRFARLARGADAPFQGARYGTGDLFEDARMTSLSVSTLDGQWREGVTTAVRELNQALTYGFTQAELNEQLANRRTALENAVEAEATRSNAALVGAALSLVANDRVPTRAAYRLAQFEAMQDEFTPDNVLSALRANSASLDDPLIRFQGRTAPDGGGEALRQVFADAMALPIEPPAETGTSVFAYDTFGEPGTVVSDTMDDRFGFRYITFANGVRLTLKQTDIQEDRIALRIALDGGNLLNTADDPLATYLASALPAGGLGAHSQDELLTILAGRSVRLSLGNSTDSFVFSGSTTPRDLDLQMKVIAAGITDPGYRAEGVEQFKRRIDNFFKSLGSTPGSALGAASGAILSDNDPRFSLQPRDDYYALDYAGLQSVMGDRLAKGAIEIALVGDFEQADAIASVAATLGALPPREADFLPRNAARERSFTESRGQKILRHKGEDDQALLRIVWPSTDNSDPVESAQLGLLAQIVRLELQASLREELGQAYSPGAASRMSREYPGYGTFFISTSLDVETVDAARAAIKDLLANLRDEPIDPDLIERARKPLLENYDNTLKTLGGWMGIARRAQSDPERLDRFLSYSERLSAVTAEDLQAMAVQYLDYDDAVEFLVIPAEDGDSDAAGGADLPSEG